jgi:phosphohistidine phosphatase
MHLYFMRHGPAEDRAQSGRDADRPLTPEGRELVSRSAREMFQLRGPGIARILSSPLIRARETALLMQRVVCPQSEIALRRELEPDDAPPLDIVHELVALGGDALLVSHQPGVEHIVRELSSEAALAMPFGFRTAMIIGLEAGTQPVGRWPLRLVLDPRKVASSTTST